MDNVKNFSKICQFPNCNIQANFNFPGESSAQFCKTHKQTGMEDKYHTKCAFDGCSLRPTYNYSREKKGLFCKQHKSPEMTAVV